MKDIMTYEQYLKVFNEQCTDFQITNKGPIAKSDGVWYSVNGEMFNITDVRYGLRKEELEDLQLKNDKVPECCPQ
jgi:hypothetical protein